MSEMLDYLISGAIMYAERIRRALTVALVQAGDDRRFREIA